MQRFKNREKRCCANAACVWRKVEKHHADLAMRKLRLAQRHEFLNARSQYRDAASIRLHVAPAIAGG